MIHVLLYLLDYLKLVIYVLFRNRQKRKSQSKRRIGMKKIEVPDEIAKDQGLQKLDKVEKFADKLKMNRTQVKSVLRGILETPDLFNFIRQQGKIN